MSYESVCVRLGDLVEERNERCRDPQESVYDKFIGLEHLDTGRLEVVRFGSTDSVTTSCKICLKGDVLFGRRNPYLRRVSMVNFDATCSGDIIVLIPDEKKIIPEYLPILLTSKEFWKSAMSEQGGTMSKRVHMEDISDYEIQLPSIEIQKKIAGLVWSLEKLIDVTFNQKNDLDLLVKSRFIEVFGDIRKNEKEWIRKPLGEFGKLTSGGTPSRKHPEYFEGHIPWISSTSLGVNYIDSSDSKYKITEEAIKNSATSLIPPGSLMIGIRINVGKSSVNKDAMCTSQDVVSLSDVDKNVNVLFLKHCLDQYIPFFEHQKKGATIKGISTKLLSSVLVPLSDIELQNDYVDFVKRVDKSKFGLWQLNILD